MSDELSDFDFNFFRQKKKSQRTQPLIPVNNKIFFQTEEYQNIDEKVNDLIKYVDDNSIENYGNNNLVTLNDYNVNTLYHCQQITQYLQQFDLKVCIDNDLKLCF